MRKSLLTVIVIVGLILGATVFYYRRQSTTKPLRQTPDIRSESGSNDQEAVQAIEKNLK